MRKENIMCSNLPKELFKKTNQIQMEFKLYGGKQLYHHVDGVLFYVNLGHFDIYLINEIYAVMMSYVNVIYSLVVHRIVREASHTFTIVANYNA